MIAMTRPGVAMVLLENKSDLYILSWHGSVMRSRLRSAVVCLALLIGSG
jgi:hypothetical protein